MKVLVLGAAGMAGHVIATYLSERGYAVRTMSGSHRLDGTTTLVDATQLSSMRAFMDSAEADVIVNAIGSLVRESSEHKDRAILLNAHLPHYLEARYRDSHTRVIHLSTDCVFSGEDPPYFETSPHDGQSFYDRSKSLGELDSAKDLTFRMSIIGPDLHRHGTGLFNWYALQTGLIYGYTGAIWNGVTTIELAKAIDAAIRQRLSGLYHLSSPTGLSKYHLLGLLSSTFQREDITIRPRTGKVSDKTLVNTRNDFDFVVSDYAVMLNELLEWITTHPHLYNHYSHLLANVGSSGPLPHESFYRDRVRLGAE